MEKDFSTNDEATIDMERRLWAYIDGQSNEEAVIERLISKEAAWQRLYAQLLQTHHFIQRAELEEPSMRFTKDIMEEVFRSYTAPATKNYINKKVVGSIAAFFILVIMGLLIYGIASVNWTESSGTTLLPTQMPKLPMDIGNRFGSLFMLINVILALLLFDRLLQHKQKKFSNMTS